MKTIKKNNKPNKPVENRRPDGTFGPGNNANPNGRPPKGWAWADVLEELAEETEPQSGKKFKELVGRVVYREAIKGNIHAARELMNRMDGMPKSSTDITTGGEKVIINLDGTPRISTQTTGGVGSAEEREL